MRNLNLIVIHCSATKEGMDYSSNQIREWHLARGFRDIGYHFVIRIDGTLEKGRDIREMGAHAKGYNDNSIGICYIGGLDSDGNAKDTRTTDQIRVLKGLVAALRSVFMDEAGGVPMRVVGHRDLSVDLNGDGVISKEEWMKQCPCFDAILEFNDLTKE